MLGEEKTAHTDLTQIVSTNWEYNISCNVKDFNTYLGLPQIVCDHKSNSCLEAIILSSETPIQLLNPENSIFNTAGTELSQSFKPHPNAPHVQLGYPPCEMRQCWRGDKCNCGGEDILGCFCESLSKAWTFSELAVLSDVDMQHVIGTCKEDSCFALNCLAVFAQCVEFPWPRCVCISGFVGDGVTFCTAYTLPVQLSVGSQVAEFIQPTDHAYTMSNTVSGMSRDAFDGVQIPLYVMVNLSIKIHLRCAH